MFNDRRFVIDCTVKSVSADSPVISVSNSVGIPLEFVLLIKGAGFETNYKVIAQIGRIWKSPRCSFPTVPESPKPGLRCRLFFDLE
jgi:hypothetical protein